MVSHYVSQNNKVQIDHLIMLASLNQFVKIDKVVLYTPINLGILGLKNPTKIWILVMSINLRFTWLDLCDVWCNAQ
jgi:hypothetical protein